MTSSQVHANDNDWRFSISGLDLKSQGLYIACALMERVGGFDFPCEGSGLIKTSYPLISGKSTITNKIEVMDMDEIGRRIHTLNQELFLKTNKNTNSLSIRWIVDTIHQLRALGVLQGIMLAHVPFVGYYDFQENKYISGMCHALIPMNHPDDKAFVFTRIIETDDYK